MTKYLIDTNLLLRSLETTHAMHSVAENAILELLKHDEHLGIVPQNIFELWNVCTRPLESNGLGYTTEKTVKAVKSLEKDFFLHLDSSEIYSLWKELIIKYQVQGVKVHDTRLVAACVVHGLSHVLTFNVKDFKRFSEITAIHPEEVNQN